MIKTENIPCCVFSSTVPLTVANDSLRASSVGFVNCPLIIYGPGVCRRGVDENRAAAPAPLTQLSWTWPDSQP